MIKNIIVVSSNKSKLSAIDQICKYYKLSAKVIPIKSMYPLYIPAEEKYNSYRFNAIEKINDAKKAVLSDTSICKEESILIANDGGVEINYFSGQPGVYTSRFLGNLPLETRLNYILSMMKDTDDVGYIYKSYTCAACLHSDNFAMMGNSEKGKVLVDAKSITDYESILSLADFTKPINQMTFKEKLRYHPSYRTIAKTILFIINKI